MKFLIIKRKRNRVSYTILLVITIILGLFSRSGVIHGFFEQYAGDTLWALMVFIILGFIFDTLPTWKNAIISLLFAYLIEFSQLYHSPLIDSIRSTAAGHLLLGCGFLETDLLCYASGIMAGVLLEFFLRDQLDCEKKDII